MLFLNIFKTNETNMMIFGNRQQFVKVLGVISIALTCQLSSIIAAVQADGRIHSASAKPVKPNIILVFIDDMGYSDFSCFGNDMAKTPQIDSLAAEGIAFEQFYVNSPICSPSRVAISTGQYPQRWKIGSFLGYRKSNEKRGMVQYLDTKAPMLARSLKEAGYATGHFGKWHMGGQRDDDTCPHITEYGFDESLTNFEGLGKRLLNHCFSPGKESPSSAITTPAIWASPKKSPGWTAPKSPAALPMPP